jgi:hypothetical protein
MRRTTNALAMLFAFVIVGVGVVSCSKPPPTTLEFESEEMTVDGLRLVETTRGHQIFLKPGIYMADFDSILVDPFMISYTNPGGASEGPVRTLDDETEEHLIILMRDMFIDQMSRSKGFDVVEQPGPRTIRVQGWLYDIVVEAPPREDPRNFPLCFAEMRAILTVRHSETAEPLARVVDEVKLSCAARRHARFHSAQWKDVEKAALKPWATFLRNWLEELRELPPSS